MRIRSRAIAPGKFRPLNFPNRLLPYVGLAAANVMLGTVPILVRLAQAEGMPTLSIATLRVLLAVILLAPHLLSRHRSALRALTRRDLRLLALAGLANSLFFVMFFGSLEHTSVLIASVFSGTNPLWVALMEVFILRAALRRHLWIGLGLVLVGGALFALSGGGGAVDLGSSPLLGGGMALLAAVGSGSYYILGRAVRQRVGALVFLWVMLLATLTVLLSIALLSGTPLTGFSVQGYVWVVLLAVGAQIIGQASIAYTLAHLSPTFVSIALQISIIISALLALLLFAEVPQAAQMIASAVIVAGVIRVLMRPAEPVSADR
jgi:drug/metabolite transporter (DMT)-like permease